MMGGGYREVDGITVRVVGWDDAGGRRGLTDSMDEELYNMKEKIGFKNGPMGIW